MLYLAFAAVGILLGFGLGRVKNAAKLAKVSALLAKLEAEVKAEETKVEISAKDYAALIIAKVKAIM